MDQIIKPESVDFNELIQNNKTLTSNCQCKMVEILNEEFTQQESRWYIANLYVYMNYHPTNDYPINLDTLVKLVGFAHKKNAKTTLENNFIKDEEWVLNKEDYTYQDVNRLWDCFGGWVNDYEINDRTFQKIQNEGSSKFVGFDALSEKINTYYTILKDRTEGFTGWDALVVWNQQTYMLDLQETLEISNYRLKTIGANQIENTFPMRQDSLTNAKLVIDFANSTSGRNHFKKNYSLFKTVALACAVGYTIKSSIFTCEGLVITKYIISAISLACNASNPL